MDSDEGDFLSGPSRPKPTEGAAPTPAPPTPPAQPPAAPPPAAGAPPAPPAGGGEKPPGAPPPGGPGGPDEPEGPDPDPAANLRKPMRIGEKLLALGLISKDQLEIALREQEKTKKLLFYLLL